MKLPQVPGQDHDVDALRAALEAAGELWLPVQGESMGKGFAAGSRVRIQRAGDGRPCAGDIVIYARNGRLVAHRVLARMGDRYVTKGDARWAWDRPLVRREEIVGVAVAMEPGGQRLPERAKALMELVCAIIAWPFWPILRRLRNKGGPPRASG